jgi:hypothetical protein
MNKRGHDFDAASNASAARLFGTGSPQKARMQEGEGDKEERWDALSCAPVPGGLIFHALRGPRRATSFRSKTATKKKFRRVLAVFGAPVPDITQIPFPAAARGDCRKPSTNVRNRGVREAVRDRLGIRRERRGACGLVNLSALLDVI